MPGFRSAWLCGQPVITDLDSPLEPRRSGNPVARIHEAVVPLPVASAGISCPLVTPDGPARFQVHRLDEGFHLRVDPIAAFQISASSIAYQQIAPSKEALAWHLFGSALGLWLELQGWPTLHAASINIDGQAIGVIGGTGRGKSTLALAMLSAGYGVLGDDHLVLQPQSGGLHVGPALPWLKVTKDTARAFGVDSDSLPPLHPNVEKRRLDLPRSTGVRRSLRLRRLYLLERRLHDGPMSVTIRRLPPARALQVLLANGFAPRTVEAVGLAPHRLGILAQAVREVGVWSVASPEGLDSVPMTREAIVSHARGAGQDQ